MPVQLLDDLLDNTLDDYLVGLAQGIQQAQRQLNQLVVTGPAGQPTVAYHLPRLDFELKMSFSLHGERRVTDTSSPTPSPTPGAKRLLCRTMHPSAANERYSGVASSTLRGSFVAVPVAGNRPPVVIRCSLAHIERRRILLAVTVQDALGEPQRGVEVQFNVDRERSDLFNAGRERQEPLSAETDVLQGVVYTGNEGRAENLLTIATAEQTGTLVVVSIDALGATETVLVRAE